MEKKPDGIMEEVVLLDPDGNEVRFDHVMTFKYEGEKYIALLPLDEVDGVDDDEVVLLKIDSSSGEDKYVTIDNEILLDEVFDEFLSLLEDMDDDEE